ncbi:MAG: division plane positioning ATPase MipZ [Pseudomonadota bacterium]|nr:division plane positioning ATPase MipZ [Pseudomonadota bacterium]
MSMIHFVGGEKGGVGKSVMARLLSQYFLDHGQRYAALDADRSHATLSRYYAEFTQPLDLERFEEADRIMETALEADCAVLIDLPAQSQRFLQRWIEDNDVLGLCEQMQIPVVYWYVVDDGVDSTDLLDQFLAAFGEDLHCVAVKNLGCGADFGAIEALPALQGETARAHQMTLPALHAETMRRIDRRGLSFWAAANLSDGDGPRMGLMERQRARVWLRKAYAGIDKALAPLSA